MKKLGRYVLIILMSIWLAACMTDTPKEVTFFIDNPTDQAMKISINDQSVDIPAGQFVKQVLPFGTHTFHFIEGQFHSDLVGNSLEVSMMQSLKNDFILNPAGAKYIIGNQRYGNVPLHGSVYSVLDGHIYYDNFSVRDDFFISKYYDYTLEQSFPESVTVDKKYDAAAKSKIFRLSDYIAYYHQNIGGEAEQTDEANKFHYANKGVFIFYTNKFSPDMALPEILEANAIAAGKIREMLSLIDAVLKANQGLPSGFDKDKRELINSIQQLNGEIKSLLTSDEQLIAFNTFSNGALSVKLANASTSLEYAEILFWKK